MSTLKPLSFGLLIALTGAAACALADERPAAPPAATTPADAAARRAELEAARAEMRALARRIAALTRELGESDGGTMVYRYLGDPDRALIGVVLGTRDDGALELRAVTPGGPADRAGLRSGDKLLAIDGRPVAGAEARAGESGFTAAGERALAAARAQLGRLEDGQEVRLTVERAGKAMELRVRAERRVSWDWPMIAGEPGRELHVIVERSASGAGPRGEDLAPVGAATAIDPAERAAIAAHAAAAAGDPAVREGIERAMGEVRRIVIDRRGRFFDLRLADLNPALGRYFGIERGVLVLDKHANTLPGLEIGDVILAIDGRRVDRAGELMRALAERADRHGVPVEVLRERRRVTLALDVPAEPDFDVLLPIPPVPPPPPTAPAPPAPMAAPQPPRPVAPPPHPMPPKPPLAPPPPDRTGSGAPPVPPRPPASPAAPPSPEPTASA